MNPQVLILIDLEGHFTYFGYYKFLKWFHPQHFFKNRFMNYNNRLLS